MANDVSTFLPAVDLQPLSTLTVTLDQVGATLSYMNVHGLQIDPADTAEGSVVDVPFAPDFSQGDLAA